MNNNLQYLKVEWLHDLPDEPVAIYMELDLNRWEKRKVEVYADGTYNYADEDYASENTGLSIEPIPPLGEMTEEFSPHIIDATEFERIWSMTRK